MSIDPKRFSLDEYVNSNWTLTVEENTSLEDVMKPDFLANIAVQLHPYDHIRVRVDSGEWYAELLVISCGRVWANTIKLCEHKLTESANADNEALNQYSVEFKGPHNKWCVIRKSDKEYIKKECATQQDATAALASYIMTL